VSRFGIFSVWKVGVMGDRAKVVSLHGAEILPVGTPRQEVIDFLERSLEAARAGEIVGVAAAFRHADECTSSGFVGETGRGLLGCLTMLCHDIADRLRR
jgi:hypothetical protein